MTPIGGIPFFLAVMAVILLSGYWLNALDLVETFAERLAVAAVAGLATLLLLVAAVNLFQPLSGVWLVVCLLPAAGSLLRTRLRSQLVADGRALLRSRPGFAGLVLSAAFLALLLSPALRDWQALFYDGTTNHDSFISITAGEYLQHHRYLEVPTPNETQPWMNMAGDNAGW